MSEPSGAEPPRAAAPPPFPRRPDPIGFWSRVAPARVALVDRATGRRWSYRELDAWGDRWAAHLRAIGIGRGAVVAALSENRPELVGLFLGCGRVGAALAPLNWRLAAAEAGAILALARPSAVFVEEAQGAAASEALARADLEARPRLLPLEADLPAAGGGVGPEVPAGADDAALVLFTSGSTGAPKGALLPRRQLLYNAVATCVGWELGPDDVAPLSTPLFHTGGWNVFATPLWHRGGTVVLLESRFDADAFLAALEEERCTVALTVPTQLLLLTGSSAWGRELPALRFFISGGAPCPEALGRRVRDAGYRFREGYGLTECGPNCFATSERTAIERPGTVGWPVPFLETRVVDEDGRDLPAGEAGELLLRGPQLFGGYLRDEERTREALTPDGWLRTGDIARVDPDGVHSIRGRRKEMYISGGENVFPGEVEAALSSCPGVGEVVVVGVPDETWGEVGRAFVVPSDGGLTEEAVLAFARERLAGYKVPRSLVFLEEMPRLGSGKPDRAALAGAGPAG